ncbi:MAG: DUF1858 domain-containing protein [Bacteroidota bacterium]
MTDRLMITPKTKVGELLEAYPALEEVLIEISPVFAKLKNPILRKTVARVATLQQAAIIGNMPVEDLVNQLRVAAGQSITAMADEENGYLSEEPPAWFDPNRVVSRFDATAMINAGDSPLNEVLHKVKLLRQGEILELKTPFVPAPIIELILDKGYRVWVNKSAGKVSAFIFRL